MRIRYYPSRDEWSPIWAETKLPNVHGVGSKNLQATNATHPVDGGPDPLAVINDIPVPSFAELERDETGSNNSSNNIRTTPPPTPAPSPTIPTNYLELDMESVRRVLVADNPTPLASQYYQEADLFYVFDSIANDFINYTRLHPASTQAELDARVTFFMNLQWAFRGKRDMYLTSRCF